MDGPLEWFAAVGAIVAGGLIAADLGRKVTGWAFVLFVTVSVAWVVSGTVNRTWTVAVQNGLLLAVNGWGVWQYLLSPKKKREIEKQDVIAKQAKREVARKQAA